MDESIYKYKAELERVIDGDTIVITLDLGLNTYKKKFKVRLARINAPEMKDKPFGLQSKTFISNTLFNKEIMIETLSDKKDKWGRYLGEIYVLGLDGWSNVNDLMVSKGEASMYKGLFEDQLENFIY